MDLAGLNSADAADAAAVVRACADVDSWVEALVAGRPWPDEAALLAAARAQGETWTPAEVRAALDGHPRIGERAQGEGAAAAMSRREQGGVATADEDLRARLADGNRRYEERFGWIYLVRAAGRSGEEMLDLLEQRLGHDERAELAVVHAELLDIALLRLRAVLA
ncbi:2-oxo-4-hydroxy-4-carboxy-5-ureidoimidazoline decarboxylase [Phycicoccus flavus]|uniref:2-oxo-4-hydroxy-4-carboxy-5-ureidoimidazoline decarboxylase n=1 Tax=Phycicoccus flavus TaxID=2502783 RepID=UPI000FEC0756|nr:2-oxo-4-hydroxy-4-carboxy-5-ureidoimidazoline decarboxylase [Phycicoccus flavus]NHA67110.1 2-oxo-4-hydroxy-4-carboxy-5-ureidoimidazoline decarboxylase [Phycicoccus flavus]